MKRTPVLSAALGLALAGGSMIGLSAITAQAATTYDTCGDVPAKLTPIRWDTNPALYWANTDLDNNNDGIACGSWNDLPKSERNPKPESVTGPSTSKPTTTAPKPKPTTTQSWPTTAPKGALYPNCTAAYADGVSDIPEDADAYGTWLDRDKDGVGCETKDAPDWFRKGVKMVQKDGKWVPASEATKAPKPTTKPSDPVKVVDKGRGVEAHTGVEGDPSLGLGLAALAGVAVAGGIAARRRH